MAHKKINVIIDGEVLVAPHFSGIGHYTLELFRAVDRALDSDTSFRFSLTVNHQLMKKAREFGFRNIHLIRSPFSARISNVLKKLGLQIPLDIIFGKGIYIFPNYSSWPLLFSKSISFIYDMTFEKYPGLVESRNQIFLSNQVYKSALRSDQIVTISNSSKYDISRHYKVSDNKIKVLYPAVDDSVFFKRDINEITRIKKKYGITGEYILFVGNIEPRKNLKNLLSAYEKLPEELQGQYSLLIVGGKGWNDGEILTLIKKLRNNGKSIILPSQHISDEDLPAIYSGSRLFVYPSLYEGFGIPPLEAMACGTPVISADNSSLPEVVGDAALLVNACSISLISSSILRLSGDNELRSLLIKKGHKQFKRFSWDESARGLINSITELL